ncbi:MAG TPA: hypothetical protein ENK49_03470, partial [Gammaproteobacteria bacterium]|nr:hypothetical protein [Gammaproteobacteria bacterium]
MHANDSRSGSVRTGGIFLTSRRYPGLCGQQYLAFFLNLRQRILPAVATAFLLILPGTSYTTNNIPGDLAPRGSPDGILTAADILVLQLILFGEIDPTNQELLAADVAPLGNVDGMLNAGDLVVLQRAVLGLVTLPPLADNIPPPQADVSLISVSAPDSGQVQVAGSTGSVEASATVKLVNYDTGTTSTVTANPDGSFNTGFAATTGQVFAVVVSDAAGNSAPSASVGVGQVLTLTVTDPGEGITVAEDSVSVTGTFSGPSGTAVTVNGRVACTVGNNFYVNNIPLEPGANTLTATATMPDGLATSTTRIITSTAVTPVTIQADVPCGYVPHAVSFVLTNNSGNAIQQIDADYDGNGTIDFSATDAEAELAYSYTATGIYQATFTIYDQTGGQYNTSQTIVVLATDSADALLRGVYNSMLNRLRVNAIDGALNYLAPIVQDKYRPVFQSLDTNLQAVVDQLGVLSGGSIGG